MSVETVANNTNSGTMKALRQLEYAKPLQVCDVPIPSAPPGMAVLQILAANVISYMKDIYNGVRSYPYPTPLTVGSSAIGRVHAVGPDATSLKKGQLVIVDITYRSRDKPTDVFLTALHEGYTPGSKSLMSHWRDGTYAEFAAVPLENAYPLDESILLSSTAEGGQNYTIPDLLAIARLGVPHGGLCDISLLPSETIIVAPATGPFGNAAVHLALSRGARVIALGRNQKSLTQLTSTYQSRFPPSRLVTVPILSDATPESLLSDIKSAAGAHDIDVFFDISPPEAANSPHIKACILALKHSGRISLMGGPRTDVPMPYSKLMHWNLTLKGKWMYEREDVRTLIKAIEMGSVLLGERGGITTNESKMKEFKLEDWENAFDWAEKHAGGGSGAYFKIGDW